MITAARRTEARLEFAGSIGTVSAADIERTGATHAVEILNRAAGVYLQRGSGQESLTAIRSPVLSGAGACGAFLVLEDSMPIRPVGFCNVNEFFEINIAQAQRVEVVRGPGSVAFGANAVHGIVNVLTPAVADLAPFAVGIDAGSDRGLRTIVERAGLSWAEAREALKDEAWRLTAEKNREELFALGLWGVPSFRVGDTAVWGQDRLWAVRDALLERARPAPAVSRRRPPNRIAGSHPRSKRCSMRGAMHCRHHPPRPTTIHTSMP